MPLLSGVLPCYATSRWHCDNLPRREQILARKRQEYRDMVPEYYDVAMSSRSAQLEALMCHLLGV